MSDIGLITMYILFSSEELSRSGDDIFIGQQTKGRVLIVDVDLITVWTTVFRSTWRKEQPHSEIFFLIFISTLSNPKKSYQLLYMSCLRSSLHVFPRVDVEKNLAYSCQKGVDLILSDDNFQEKKNNLYGNRDKCEKCEKKTSLECLLP